mmetsp:Transcript_16732/g.20121  ORF Transcript_16732/g.20121 Transcript_16732/m.20121 type:complete len:213 (-) Transcript_16732:1184-1822(-)
MTLIFRVLCFPVYLIQKLLATIFYIILGVEKSVGWHRSSIERVCDNLNIDISKHVVDTADGHTLTLHRLRFKNHDGIKTYTSSKGKSVLLQHGLLESSIVWVAYGKVSLAFMLLEQGFDVWVRLNMYPFQFILTSCFLNLLSIGIDFNSLEITVEMRTHLDLGDYGETMPLIGISNTLQRKTLPAMSNTYSSQRIRTKYCTLDSLKELLKLL